MDEEYKESDISKEVKRLMDEEGYEFGEAVKEAMAKGDLETAQTLYSKYMTVLDEYLSPPYPDYYKTQQHIWKCIWMRFGNRVIRGKLPQAPSNDFDSVD